MLRPTLLNVSRKIIRSIPVAKAEIKASSDSSTSSTKGMWGIFFIAFLSGFAALLTPCVFPMIPLTVSFFTNNESKSNSKFNAFVYGFFIVGIYLALSIPFHFLDSLDP